MRAYTDWWIDTYTDADEIARHEAEADSDAALDAIFAPVPVDDSQLALDLFDYDGALQELVDGIEDESYWRRGGC